MRFSLESEVRNSLATNLFHHSACINFNGCDVIFVGTRIGLQICCKTVQLVFISVTNKWIRELGQEFRRPCGLHPDAVDRSWRRHDDVTAITLYNAFRMKVNVNNIICMVFTSVCYLAEFFPLYCANKYQYINTTRMIQHVTELNWSSAKSPLHEWCISSSWSRRRNSWLCSSVERQVLPTGARRFDLKV